MIPYITVADLPKLPISTFSALVLTGLLLGSYWAVRRGGSLGLNPWHTMEMIIWTVLPAYLGSHMLDVVFYFPEKLIADPAILFQFDKGMSSFGGLLVAAFAGITFLRITGNISQWKERGDILIQGFIVAWIFGRMGCFITHDHPGILSDFVLAVNYPGGSRHDLGFYDMLYITMVLFPVSIWVFHKKLTPGSQLVAFGLLYAPYRWSVDFLRINDVRYFSWTPGQYASVILLMAAFIIFFIIYRPISLRSLPFLQR